MAQTQRIVQLVIPSQEVMNRFCYAYARALLKKLKEMRLMKETYLGGDGAGNQLTPLALAVVRELKEQVRCSVDVSEYSKIQNVDHLIEVTEQFLAIFEV